MTAKHFMPALQRPQIAALLSSLEHNNVLLDAPSLLLQAVIIPGDKTTEGELVQAVALPWFDIIEIISCSPETIYQIDWPKCEEIMTRGPVLAPSK